jgi:hypothetical protein
MQRLVERAREIVEALERSDVGTVARARSGRLADWDPGLWIEESWMPRLGVIAGVNRRVVDGWRVHGQLARFEVVGDVGTAFVTVLLDDDGLFGLDITREVRDGSFGIAIGCTKQQHDSLQEFWTRLVDAPLGFGDGAGEAPRWPDPAYPQQIHLDVVVPDLDAAEAEVLANGARRLADSGSFRVYSDPVGHPFCLYLDTDGRTPEAGRLGVLERVVFDCSDPAELAAFWSGLLDMPERLEESADRIVIGRSDSRLPNLAMQRVHDYHPPRWPDARYPEQLHLDLSFDDRESRERLAQELGATRLPPQGGSCPVYADPAGHPFCLCMTGE